MSKGERYASKAFESIILTDKLDSVYYMHYTSRYHILPAEKWGDESTFHASIPGSGFVYIFDTPQTQFYGLNVVFLDNDGNTDVVLNFDDELRRGKSFSPMRTSTIDSATQHLSNANDIAAMYLETYRIDDDNIWKKNEKNVWHMLSEKQVSRMDK